MQLSAFGITAGHGKAAPSAGHDASVCTLVNSSCSVGVVPVANGNWISRAPSPGTFRTSIFRQFWECKIAKTAPHHCGNGTFVPNFRSSKFRFFRSERFRVKRLGIPALYATFVETATLQPKTAGQHKTTFLVVTLARPPWVSVLEI